MTDDPRDVLKAAGVECAELDKYKSARLPHEEPPYRHMLYGKPVVAEDCADAAILAVARLAVRYKWMAEHEGHHIAGEWFIDSRDEDELDFLEREANHA